MECLEFPEPINHFRKTTDFLGKTQYVPQADKTRKQFMGSYKLWIHFLQRGWKKGVDSRAEIRHIPFAVPKWRNW
ncbi:MAG: hypothetical protein D3916_08970 [Candidatus Electrothrix sp. MAN1_4]|nr:hypothetical protein [Candidatus Electrothrix sp. MAN1_4]